MWRCGGGGESSVAKPLICTKNVRERLREWVRDEFRVLNTALHKKMLVWRG